MAKTKECPQSGNLNEGRVYPPCVLRRVSGGAQPLAQECAARFRHSSLDQWRDHVTNGRVFINGVKVCDPTSEVHDGDVMVYHRPPWREPLPCPPDALQILFRDASVLVVAKPNGLPVMHSELYYQHTVMETLKRMAEKEGGPVPAPLHRLGCGTTGALLCGLTKDARRSLSTQFQNKTIFKVYRALVSGRPSQDRYEINAKIGLQPYDSRIGLVHQAVVDPTVLQDKAMCKRLQIRNASSILTVLERRATDTIVQVRIFTGRPHQIRIHAAYIGHPLVGDPLYCAGGVTKSTPHPELKRMALPRDCGYLLHAHRIAFRHPSSGEECDVEAPLPAPLRTRKERMEASHKARGGAATNQEEELVAAANGNVSESASTNEKSSLASAPANHTLLSTLANQTLLLVSDTKTVTMSSLSPPKRKHTPSPTNQHTVKSVKTNQKAEVVSASTHAKPPSLDSTNHTAAAPPSDTSA